jgi:CheY-like chemotaxis protein
LLRCIANRAQVVALRRIALRSIPIITVTVYALSGEGQKARAAGCNDYVPKPFSPRQLLAKIRQYLQWWPALHQTAAGLGAT